MYYVLSVFLGLLSTVMVAMNGKLGGHYGIYTAAVIIHVLGLLSASAIVLLKRERIANKQPFVFYIGGAIGFFCVILNSVTFGHLSVSAILALGLLGQSLASLIFDQFGLYGMQKHPFNFKKTVGLVLVMIGVVFMVISSSLSTLPYVFFSLLSGAIVVIARTFNARLAKCTNNAQSTFFNYASGLIVSIIALFAFGNQEPLFTAFSLSPEVWIYFGGLLGVGYVIALNLAVNTVPSFYLSLLLFIGQVFSGIGADALLTGVFSLNNLIGGIFVTAGLVQNLWIEKRIVPA